MTQASQSRAVASVAHCSDVARAEPFGTDSEAIRVIPDGSIASISAIQRALPEGWRVRNLADMGSSGPEIHVFSF